MKFLLWAGLLIFLFRQIGVSQPTEGLSIRDAVFIASQNNPTILQAQREVEASAGRHLQAGGIPNPEISVTLNEVPTNLRFSDAGERDIGISQTIKFPGKRGSRVDAAERGFTIAQLSLKRTSTIISAQVKTAYYKALLTAGVVESVNFTISLMADFLAVLTQRYQAGSSRYLDVIRAKVELTRLRNDLTEAKRDYEIRISELNILIGRPGEQQLVLTDSMPSFPITLSEDSTVAHYSQQSAFLEIVAQEVSRAQSLLSLSEKSYLPDFTVGAALQNRPGQVSPTGSSHYFGLAASVSVPLWFWHGPRGEVQEAQATLDAISIRREATGRLVRQKIRAAYRTARAAEEQRNVFDTSLLRDVEDELRAGIAAYQNNQIDALNLLDIHRTYKAAKVEYARALYNFSVAVVALETARELPE